MVLLKVIKQERNGSSFINSVLTLIRIMWRVCDSPFLISNLFTATFVTSILNESDGLKIYTKTGDLAKPV